MKSAWAASANGTHTPVHASAFGCITFPFLVIAIITLAWDDDVNNPRLAGNGVWNAPGVVRVEPGREVRCQAGVVARWIGVALENVDDGLGEGHAGGEAKSPPRVDTRKMA